MKYKENLDTKLQNFHHEAGFMMMVIPVFLLLFSFFVAAMLKETKPNEFYFEANVQHNMEDVRTALATYAHRNYRIPCPGSPTSTLPGEELRASGDCVSNVGILPYRELGLPEIAAKDKWGHFYTYKVSPDFTRIVDTGATMQADDGTTVSKYVNVDGLDIPRPAVANYVHKICQTEGWIKDNATAYKNQIGNDVTFTNTSEVEDSLGNLAINRNIYKANFCCPSNASLSAPITPGGGVSGSVDASQYANGGLNALSLTMQDEVTGTDVLQFSLEPLDSLELINTIADNTVRITAQNFLNTTGNGYLNLGNGQAQGLIYNPALNGGGLGINAESTIDGKNYAVGVALNFLDPNGKPNKVKLVLTDAGGHDEHSPIQLSMRIVDDAGNLITTVSYIVQSPSNADLVDNKAEIKVGISDLIGNADQLHLVNVERQLSTNWGANTFNLQKSVADNFFYQNQRNFKRALHQAGIIQINGITDPSHVFSDAELNSFTLTDSDIATLGIEKIKFNAAHSSLAFRALSFSGTPPSTPVVTSNPTDLIAVDEGGNPILALRDEESSYGPVNEASNGIVIPQDFEAVAYALISHGADGEGAFMEDGTQVDNILAAQESDFEKDNHSTPNIVRDMRKISADTSIDKYDDIVMWDSQLTLYNSLRNGTCESAQAL